MGETARIVKAADFLTNEKSEIELKEHVLSNKLIGFPTETVYGLGGNSLNEISLKNIFEMKKRPTNDPIISHVFNLSQAFEQLYEINLYEKYILHILNSKFWPGPLSVIAKAKRELPLLLTANTQFCAVRMPKNVVARKIIKTCEVPIAAPSANKFQHISPTTAQHVLEEFKDENILICDDGQCEVGIESTVVKLVKYWKKKNDVEENEEVIIDKEYELEKEKEYEQLQFLENEDKKSINNKGPQSLTERLKVYDTLQLHFDNIQKEKHKKSYIYNQIIKYKNIYQYSIIIYRRGKYTKQEIEDVLKKNELLKDINVDFCQKIRLESLNSCNEKNKKSYENNVNHTCDLNDDISCLNKEKKENSYKMCSAEDKNSSTFSNKQYSHKKDHNRNHINNNFISPGMMLTHYSPFVSTYMIKMVNIYKNGIVNVNKKKEFHLKCKDCVLLDIGNSMIKYKNQFLKYINIFHNPDLPEKCLINYTTKNFFLCLREAEKNAIELNGQSILISVIHLNSSSEEWLSLFDRIYRASSGKELYFQCHDEDITLVCN